MLEVGAASKMVTSELNSTGVRLSRYPGLGVTLKPSSFRLNKLFSTAGFGAYVDGFAHAFYHRRSAKVIEQ
jgi:hypothetical protein